MPFPTQTSRLFSREGIEALAPNQAGVYGIFRSGQWIYIGRAGCLRARLLEHFSGVGASIAQHMPTHFVTVLSGNPETTEKQLIAELNPIANQRVG